MSYACPSQARLWAAMLGSAAQDVRQRHPHWGDGLDRTDTSLRGSTPRSRHLLAVRQLVTATSFCRGQETVKTWPRLHCTEAARLMSALRPSPSGSLHKKLLFGLPRMLIEPACRPLSAHPVRRTPRGRALRLSWPPPAGFVQQLGRCSPTQRMSFACVVPHRNRGPHVPRTTCLYAWC
jgi:hypothetical protein